MKRTVWVLGSVLWTVHQIPNNLSIHLDKACPQVVPDTLTLESSETTEEPVMTRTTWRDRSKGNTQLSTSQWGCGVACKSVASVSCGRCDPMDGVYTGRGSRGAEELTR
eukprot:2377912-Prymnesium_polylepis.2